MTICIEPDKDIQARDEVLSCVNSYALHCITLETISSGLSTKETLRTTKLNKRTKGKHKLVTCQWFGGQPVWVESSRIELTWTRRWVRPEGRRSVQPSGETWTEAQRSDVDSSLTVRSEWMDHSRRAIDAYLSITYNTKPFLCPSNPPSTVPSAKCRLLENTEYNFSIPFTKRYNQSITIVIATFCIK